MPAADDQKIYEALVIPNEALDQGGVEILRAGLVADNLYVTARRVFKDPATWGEVLGDITRRLAHIYANEGDLTRKEALAAIMSAFAADLGAPPVAAPRRKRAAARKPARSPARRKPTKRKAR
jgi:Domain of unknown function (DUF5076)